MFKSYDLVYLFYVSRMHGYAIYSSIPDQKICTTICVLSLILLLLSIPRINAPFLLWSTLVP